MDAKGRVARLVRQERALAVGCDEARLLGSQEVPLQLGAAHVVEQQHSARLREQAQFFLSPRS